MRIAYLAWGSLLWDYNTLPISFFWKKTNFKLPLEYSRRSKDGRLTLVIDKKGTYNTIWYSTVDLENLNLSIKILKKREKTSIQNIHYINLRDNKHRGFKWPQIIKWAEKHKYDAVIWTGLSPNFTQGITHIKKQPLNKQLLIIEYIIRSNRIGHIETRFSKKLFNKIHEIVHPN